MTSPEALLSMARGLLDAPHSRIPVPLRTRAAAFLARQALEAALDDYWKARGLPLDRCPMRAQLVCLREYAPADDASTASAFEQTWATLSRACHHHPYELTPTIAELRPAIALLEGALAHGLGDAAPPQGRFGFLAQ